MTKNHENKLTMYLGVISVLDENSANTAGLAALSQPIANFKNLVGSIKTKSTEYDSVATGKTQIKLESEDALVEVLIPAAYAFSAYAHTIRDTELWSKAEISESALRKLRDTEIIMKANGLLELIEAKAAELTDYGITAETIKSIRQKIDMYEQALGKKESVYSDRTSARKTLFDLFDEADIVLTRQIDPLMEQFWKNDPEFYNAYFQARYLKNLGAARKAKPAEVPVPAAVS